MKRMNESPTEQYMSRKYTLTLIALIATSYKLVVTSDPMWAIALTGCLVGIIGQYGYFNTQESKTLKEIELKKMDMSNGKPVEPAGE